MCSAPGRHPPPWWGGTVFAPLRKRAAPPPGFYPARGPRLASRIPGLPSLDHGGGGRLRSTPQACGAAAGALPGAQPAPPQLRFSGPVGPARIPRSFPSISASLFVRAGRPGPPLRRRLSAVTTSGGDVCPAALGGGACPRSALQGAAPPPGTYPARNPRLAAPPLGPRGPGSDPRSPSPRPQWWRSSSLRSASTLRRRRGSTRCAARVPAASLLGACGPGSDPPFLPINLRVALRARGPVGPAAMTPSFGCDHLRGGTCAPPPVATPPLVGGDRLRSAPQARGAAARVLPGARPAPRLSDPRSPSPRPRPGGGGGRLRSAPQACGAAAGALPGARPAPPPLRFSGPVGQARNPRSFTSNLRVALRARGPAGPAATPPSFGCDHLRGGRVLRPPCGGACPRSALQGAAPPPGTYPARAARALQLRLSGPVGPARTPGLPPPDHSGGGRLRSAPQARCAAAGALPGARPASQPPRFSGPWARLGSPFLPINLRVALRARGPAGPAATTQSFGCDHLRGDVCSAPGRPPFPLPGGGGASSLRSASAWRRRPGSTRRAARASPLRPPVSLPSTTVAAVVFAPLQWHHCLPKLCIITLHKLCIIIMQINHPSHFCIITISPFLALGAQSEIANVLPKRCASRKRPHLPDYANIMQNYYAKFMQDDYAKFMQGDYAKFMQHNYAKFMQEDYAKSKYSKSEKMKNCKGRVTYFIFSWVF